MSDWRGNTFEVRLGPPGHGGFCVGRHEGRVVFVRHGLPDELVRVRVTEDRGGSFCRADAISILEASPDRVPATCPVSGPGGAGCCDFSYATPAAQRALKAAVVIEQLRRVAGIERDVVVEPIAGYPADSAVRWRTRVRLAVDAQGRAGVHGYRSDDIIADLRCPQPVSGALDGVAERSWTPGADLVIAVDGDGMRHIVELAPAAVAPSRGERGRQDRPGPRGGRGADRRRDRPEWRRGDAGGHDRPAGDNRGGADRRRGGERGSGSDSLRGEDRRSGRRGDQQLRYPGEGRDPQLDGGSRRDGRDADRRNASARRAATHAARDEWVVAGSGRTVEYVAGRRWELSATGFWQAHRAAAQCYSDLVAEWADLSPGARAWDLYSGVGVFAARLADQVGQTGSVFAVESARSAVADGTAALGDLPWLDLRAQRVEHWLAEHASGAAPDVVVLDPPRAGAGKEVVSAVTTCGPGRIIHIGCDPASFARDLGLYEASGYRLAALRAFDAFPATHHVECVALLER